MGITLEKESKKKRMTGELVGVDWFQAHSDSLKKLKPQISESFEHYRWAVWPNSEEYYLPFPTMSVVEEYEPKTLAKAERWLVRDGLVPLIWFFKLNPSPDKHKIHLIVNENIAPFVPTAWRKNVSTWRTVFLNEAQKKERNKLLIFVIAAEPINPIDEISRKMENLVSFFGKARFQEMEKHCLVINKEAGFKSLERFDYLPKVVFEMVKKSADSNWNALGWKEFALDSPLQDYWFADLNSTRVYADNYVTYSALRRGAQGVGFESDTALSKGDELVQLSPYHGLALKGPLGGSCLLDSKPTDAKARETWVAFESLMRSDANKNWPWPEWVHSWKKKSESALV